MVHLRLELVAPPHVRWHRCSSEPGAPTAEGRQIARVWWSWDPEEPLCIVDRWVQKTRNLKVVRKREKWDSFVWTIIYFDGSKTLWRVLAAESKRGCETLRHRRYIYFLQLTVQLIHSNDWAWEMSLLSEQRGMQSDAMVVLGSKCSLKRTCCCLKQIPSTFKQEHFLYCTTKEFRKLVSNCM